MIGVGSGRCRRGDLITGMAQHVGSQRIAGVLWAYFDESGKLADSDFICLCGYLWDDASNQFADEWRHELHRLGIPFLHTTALFARREPYERLGWTDDRRDDALGLLAQAINRHALVGIGCAVDAKHYRTMSPQQRNLMGGRHPEDFIFHRLLKIINDIFEEWGQRQPVSLIFDWEERFAPKCLSALVTLRKHKTTARQNIASIGFADDVIFPPLQAADMLAFATRRHLRERAPAYWSTLMDGSSGKPPVAYRSEFYDAAALNELPDRVRAGTVKLL